MSNQFDDPDYAPPADLTAAEARAYEEALLRTITDAIRPGRLGHLIVDSIALTGTRPDTAVVFTYREESEPERRLLAAARIWDDLAQEGPDGTLWLGSAPERGTHIASYFIAEELEPRALDD